MLDEFEKYIDKRIDKAAKELKMFGSDRNNYLIYKNIIIELKTIKEYINRKRKR